MTSTNGVEITGYITSLAIPTPILTTRDEDSFSRMLAGCCAKNIPKSLDAVKRSTLQIFYVILSSSSSESRFTVNALDGMIQQINVLNYIFLIVCRKLCPSRFRYYIPLAVTLCLVMPAVVPWYFWDESLQTAFFVASVFRYVLTLHATWLTNSAAHIWGYHPYDK